MPISNLLIIIVHSWTGILLYKYFTLKGTDWIISLVLININYKITPLVINITDLIL